MKTKAILRLTLLLMLSSLLNSCEAIAGIFKIGMGFGVFLVIAVIVVIVYFITKAGKNKSN